MTAVFPASSIEPGTELTLARLGAIEEEMETDRGRGASGLLSVKGKDAGRETWGQTGKDAVALGRVELNQPQGMAYVLRRKAGRAVALRHS